MILGQLTMGARQTKNAPLTTITTDIYTYLYKEPPSLRASWCTSPPPPQGRPAAPPRWGCRWSPSSRWSPPRTLPSSSSISPASKTSRTWSSLWQSVSIVLTMKILSTWSSKIYRRKDSDAKTDCEAKANNSFATTHSFHILTHCGLWWRWWWWSWWIYWRSRTSGVLNQAQSPHILIL